MEVLRDLVLDANPGVIVRNCTVTLGGEDSELNLAENTNLLFQCTDAAVAALDIDAVAPESCADLGEVASGDYTNFTILAGGAGFEIEVQVKKNSTIEAQDFTITVTGAEEAEAQFEEDFTLILHGNLTISMNTGTDEGGDVQFKKVSLPKAIPSPNIDVAGDISITVGGGDSEIQIEEDNYLRADDISLTGNGLGSQVQTKKNVTLEATAGSVSLTAPGSGGEVQAEDNNDFDATGSITVASGAGGKTEVKKGSVFTAPATVTTGAGGVCKVEDPIVLTVDCT